MCAPASAPLPPCRRASSQPDAVGEVAAQPRVRASDVPRLSPSAIAIAEAALASVAEEMGEALGRSAFSPNIKERRDYSCAVFDGSGQMVAQAAHIPVHLGAMPEAVRAIATLAPYARGDVYALNDPFLGGTHLPDITTVTPVFAGDADSRAHIGFVATRAHHADIGGIAPGSMP